MSEIFDNNQIFTMDQAIDLCLSPKYNFLQMILSVIVNKLNLKKSVFALDAPEGKGSFKFYERPELVKMGKGKSGVPVRARSLDLTKYGHVRENKRILFEKTEPSHANSFIRRTDVVQENTDAKINNIQKSLGKVTAQIERLTFQQENLDRKVNGRDMSSFTILNVPGVDQSPDELDHQKSFSDKLIISGDGNGLHKLYRKDLARVRKEFNEHFCVLTKKVLKLSKIVEEYKDAANKMDLVKKILDKVAPKDYVDSVIERVDYLCTQTCDLKKEIGTANSKIQDIAECADYTEKRIKEIQEKLKMLDKIREILERLDSFDKWKKKIHDELEKFTEITEHLKIIKADREELDYIFEEKADRDELLKLVTLEFFKSVQDDLSSGIVQVLEQLMRDEIEWEKAHKEIQLMLDVKADSCEVTSLKRYINCKLEIIQKKLNDIIRNKLTAHAAAVKIRLLKNARCITCTTEADLNKLQYPIPLLGRVREYEVKCVCEPRTRYCGGGHTVVGPDQKLITKQKQPLMSATATTLNFTMTQGADGRLYRTRKQKCICEPIPPEEEETKGEKKLFPC